VLLAARVDEERVALSPAGSLGFRASAGQTTGPLVRPILWAVLDRIRRLPNV
jgi:hypothetical protein